MYNLFHKTIFTFRINQILLNIFSENIVIAQPKRLFDYSYDLFENKEKYIDNERLKKNDKDALPNETRYKFQNNIIYEYDNLLSEYYFGDATLKSNITGTQQKKILPNIFLNYIFKNNTLKRSRSTRCFLNDIRIHRQISKLRRHRLWELVKIWFLVYLALAVPLWCTKGWCCCCLPCKFFKPNKIIKEAKLFLELNPPGVYKHRGGVIHYEPSDIERDCYEKLEHVIRTI